MWKVLSDEKTESKPLLVMANKQDWFSAVNAVELADKLDLGKIKDRQWEVQPATAYRIEDIQLDWLVDTLIGQK